MHLSAQVSVYPLRQEQLSGAIQAAVHAFEEHGLDPQIGPMSTSVSGDAEALFRALQDAFARAADYGHVVMTVTLSNACPL